METIAFDIIERVFLPILTLLGGWFGHMIRTKQKKEADVLDNVKQILDVQKAYIERQDTRYRELEEIYHTVERKLDNKRASISKANKCKYTNEGEGCPVLAHEEQLDDKCKNCEIKHKHDNCPD
jgi:hypothetical protein